MPNTEITDGGNGAGLERQATEELLAVFDIYQATKEQLSQLKVSPDNRHMAYVEFVGERFRVTMDQQAGEVVDLLSKNSLKFSPDSSRFAYIAGDEQRMFLEIDGRKVGPFANFVEWSPQFSPDSQKVAYGTMEGDKIGVYIDEEQLFTADIVGNALAFSPNSKRFAIRAGMGGKQCIVVDGQAGPFYDQVDNPYFSPDNQRLAYAAKKGEHWFIVVDGEEGPRFKDATEPVFSPDSQRIAYYAQKDDGMYLVMDDEVIGPHYTFGQAPFGMFKFSPDSRHMAYVVHEAKKFLFLRHGHSEYVAGMGRQGKSYEVCGNLAFSPDSRRFGYVAFTDKKAFVIVDEEVYGPYQDGRDDSPVFSPDSKRFAFAISDLGVMAIYIDGELLDSHPLAFTPIFSPGGEHFAYGAYDQDGGQVMIDKSKGKRYKELMTGGQKCVKFDGERELHYIASSLEAPDHWMLVTETF